MCGEAKSGAEALALALQLRPDVVILDINMPGMSGLDALKAIRERLPATQVVVLTLHYSADLVREIMQCGRARICDEVGRGSRVGGSDRGSGGGEIIFYAGGADWRRRRFRRRRMRLAWRELGTLTVA